MAHTGAITMTIEITLTNELSRKIVVRAGITEAGDVELGIIGPLSETTNLMTRNEAEAVHKALGVVLNGEKGSWCGKEER